MAGINICATLGGNVGKPNCDVRFGRPKNLLPTRGKVFSAADLLNSATIKAALRTAMLLAREDNNKVFAFPNARVVDDNTADVSLGTLADGYEEVLNESLPSYNLQTTAGICVAQAMTQFNGWSDKSFIVDDKNIFWYIINEDGSGQGFSIGNMYTNPPRFGNSGGITVSNTRVLFGSIDEFKHRVGAIKLDFDVLALQNTVDVVLSEAVPATANALKIIGRVLCAGTDIYAAYSAGLANVARWVATNVETGAPITLTSVAVDAALKGWTLTLDNTAHGALDSGALVEINLADPATLAAAGFAGIEGIAFIYTKP